VRPQLDGLHGRCVSRLAAANLCAGTDVWRGG
jgi:hypothetical protein